MTPPHGQSSEAPRRMEPTIQQKPRIRDHDLLVIAAIWRLCPYEGLFYIRLHQKLVLKYSADSRSTKFGLT
ncbi:hypothetical protein TNCV_2454881 [Trichonephila clavipes]|nr:hypothetical protein TNCV_2454881 [Trichonephila clavipes]